MTKHRLAWMLVIVTSVVGGASAAPNTIGAGGDSMVVGFNANDACDDLLECIGNFGADASSSFATGWSAASIRTYLAASGVNTQQANGASWMAHGPSQTSAMINAGGAHTVVLSFGGNDLLQSLGGTLPTKEEIRLKVRASFDALSNAPAASRPAQVIVNSVPKVTLLRTLMKDRKHFAFETCQGIWDNFSGPISKDLKVCDVRWWNPVSWLCGVANLMQKWTNWVDGLKNAVVWAWDAFGTPKFPGGYVLNSAAPESNRTLAAARQVEYNQVLAEEVAAYNGRNGVKFVFSSALGAYTFDASQVSQLDCFHPNRTGQKAVAQMVWNQVRPSIYPMGVYGGATGTGNTDTSPTVDTIAPVIATGWSGTWANSYTQLRQSIPTVRGNASDLSGDLTVLEVWAQNYGYDSAYACAGGAGCYLGKVREANRVHEIMIDFYSYNGYLDDAGNWDYWRVNVKPQDNRGNGTTIFSGPWY